ncbi:MAG TPA: TetR/AcrR family transcriptional regulator [Acidimicrobiales bacterium]|nr:TetR/AcrR family transcriptional regulator [Acidimicrobiales bacterium]
MGGAPPTSTAGADRSPPAGPSSRLLPRPERRRSIVAGAARAFAATGFEATSMEEIAESAGVSKLIVYRHFESKEELYRCILEQAAGRLAQLVAAALGGDRPAQMRTAVVGAFMAAAREDPDGFRLLWRHSWREPRFARYAAEVNQAAVDYARGFLAPRLADRRLVDWAAATVVRFLVEATLNWLDHGSPEGDEEIVALTSASLLALVRTWS